MFINTAYGFQSSSSTEVYQTLVFEDGKITCNCPGWTRRIVDGVRTCKHVRFVEMGIARNQCVSFKDYREDNPLPPVKTPARKTEPKKPFYASDYPPSPVVVPKRKTIVLKQSTGKPQSVCVADRNIDFSAL